MDDLDKGFLRHADTNTNVLHETDEEHLLFCNTQPHGIDVAEFNHSEDLNYTDVNAAYSEQSDCTQASMAETDIDMSWESILVLAPDTESFDTSSTHITPDQTGDHESGLVKSDETAGHESGTVKPVYYCCCQVNGRACTCDKDTIRMLKNRASAQKSRSIKAHKLVHLHEELALYKRTCDALRTQNALLKVQNADLTVKLFSESLS